VLGVSNVALKRYAEAVTEMKRANALGATPMFAYGLGYAYAVAGNRSDARAIIEELKRSWGKSYVPAYFIASIYAALAERDQAFAWLRRAYDERDHNSHIYFAIRSSIRSDPIHVSTPWRVRSGSRSDSLLACSRASWSPCVTFGGLSGAAMKNLIGFA
jgi:tetratricopeptide (TPR) repeat protein